MTEQKEAPKNEEATETKTKKAKGSANPKPAPAPKDTKNGITRPKAGTQTGRVWEIADQQSKDLGEPAPRKMVLDKFVEEGGNVATGATQYGRWRKYHGLEGNGAGRPKKEAATAKSETTVE